MREKQTHPRCLRQWVSVQQTLPGTSRKQRTFRLSCLLVEIVPTSRTLKSARLICNGKLEIIQLYFPKRWCPATRLVCECASCLSLSNWVISGLSDPHANAPVDHRRADENSGKADITISKKPTTRPYLQPVRAKTVLDICQGRTPGHRATFSMRDADCMILSFVFRWRTIE